MSTNYDQSIATYDPIIRDIECRRDTEAETVTDYDSGDVGGTEAVCVKHPCGQPLAPGICGICADYNLPPTCHGTGVRP